MISCQRDSGVTAIVGLWLSTVWTLNRFFCLIFGTTAALAQEAVGLGWDRTSHRRALQASSSFAARHWSQILAVSFQG